MRNTHRMLRGTRGIGALRAWGTGAPAAQSSPPTAWPSGCAAAFPTRTHTKGNVMGNGQWLDAIRTTVKSNIGRLAAVALLAGVSGAVCVLPSSASPVVQQLAGTAAFDTTAACGAPPAGYADFTSYPAIVMMGSLEGCWFTKVESIRDNGAPSGIYLESGEEVFVGTLNGGPRGTFATTYRFESRWSPDVSTGAETRGRCQHPIGVGSGTGGFAGAVGRVDFKDVVANGTYVYRGHIALP